MIQEVVGRPRWKLDNSLALILTGSGERTAESFDGDSRAAPLLHVEWKLPEASKISTATAMLSAESAACDPSPHPRPPPA